ncbi:MAG: flavin monoamine oxidase family protein [Rhodanobacteraceae bacterium]
MADQVDKFVPSRRDVLRMIGLGAGGAAMYQAMSSLGFARESKHTGPVDLSGAPRGASVLILGAGMAGMTAAYELRNAGYKVRVLEYNARPGGRNWTLRGGDTYTELGGEKQTCEFDKGLYINPGPWRIPYHHQNLLHYCDLLGVKLEPFVQVNYNAYLHSQHAFDGKPQRYRAFRADYQGMVAELLAKSVSQNALDAPLDSEDREKLLASLQSWGFLDGKYRYMPGESSSAQRGYDKDPGGGLDGRPVPSQPIAPKDVLRSQLWQTLFINDLYEFQTTLFQPVGGMGRIGEAFGRELGDVIQYNTKVTRVAQDEHGVTAHFEDTGHPGSTRSARGDWCLCTIPLSILGQIPMNVGTAMAEAIAAVPYAASTKIGLQFKRRFWEQDEQIYGGITYTDLPINTISYPSSGFFQRGPGVLLGAYNWGPAAFQFTAMNPAERVREAVRLGGTIHPQYASEFQNGVAVAWHRSPFTMGCFGEWTEESRAKHYDNLCRVDGRIALAGEHASYLPAWQEGAITSALDAIGRVHRRAIAGGVA